MIDAITDIWSGLAQWLSLHHIGQTIDFFCAYFAIKLGYAAFSSILVFGFCVLVRAVWPKNRVGLRLLCWTPILLIPFLSRLKAYYEVKLLFRVYYRWYWLCGEVSLVKYIYLLGCVVIAAYLLKRHMRLRSMVSCADERELFGEKVYVLPFDTGAFSMGIVHPRIVIPENVMESCTDDEIRGIILHEKTHLKSGHIIMLTVWNVLRVLYWSNPLLHIGMRYFKEDIEYNCDMSVLDRNMIRPHEYGNLLLRQVLIGRSKVQGDIAPFSGQNGYKTIHKRILGISKFDSVSRTGKAVICGMTAVFLVMAVTVLKQQSYPRYTSMSDISVTNDRMETLLVEDEKKLVDVVEIHDDYLLVDRDALKSLLPEGSMETRWLFLSFGGYMKMPGIGGAGDGAILEAPYESGVVKVPYITTRDDILVKILKWI